MIVADSDVLIDALRGREPMASRIALEIGVGALATTVVNVFELQSGARKAAECAKVESLLGPAVVLPLDEKAAERAAAIRRDLESRGEPIGMADYLIAGICVAHSAVLLTRNRDHFERIRGLRLGSLEG